MAEKIVMTALSPTMETGVIGAWIKKEGEEIQSGDVLCEVETDKATMDYESTQEGVLLKIVVPEGGSAEVGQTIAVVGEEGEDTSGITVDDAPAPALPSVPEGEEDATQAAPDQAPPVPAAPAAASPGEWIPSSPLARIIAEKEGINLSLVRGTGPGGRIVKRDVEKALSSGAVRQKTILPVSSAEKLLREESNPVTQKRKVIAQRLSESKFTAPHYYLKLSVRADNLLSARKTLNSGREKKVSFNAFLMKFAAEALKLHPAVNSSWQEDSILSFGSADIGLAVAQEDGLITPVVKGCDTKGIVAIQEDLDTLIPKAQSGKLQPEEFTGATFTITNLGSFGIEEFTAIINPPGSAILAVGAVTRQIVIGPEGSQSVASVMKLTLSCDHRVIDGAVGAAFLKDLKDLIEYPVRVLY